MPWTLNSSKPCTMAAESAPNRNTVPPFQSMYRMTCSPIPDWIPRSQNSRRLSDSQLPMTNSKRGIRSISLRCEKAMHLAAPVVPEVRTIRQRSWSAT